MSDQYYLPSQTAQLLTLDRLQRCRNLGLLLDKYPPRTAIDTGSKSDGKSSWLRGFTSDNHIDTQLVENVYKRWQSAITAMQAQYFTATTAWHMVVGLGGETVLETDLTLHHLYGIPFIPGSALKGLTRSYVTGEIEGHKSKKIEDDDSDIQRIFGSQESAGSVIFFDALPINGKINFDLDIMNAHYPKYYGEKQPPANNQDPNPVTFLTVADTTFLFALAPRRSKDTEDVGLAIGWLQKALKDYGVGGKTSAGYGYFQISETSAKTGKSSGQPSQAGAQIAAQLRQNLPQFREGQELQNCQVIVSTERMQKLFPTASAYLRYQEFPPQALFIAIESDVVEARDWKLSESRGCVISRIEEHEDCLILVCKPRQKKNRNNKAKK
jgi:CRISPR type III-B/RAMP module RAMP protein Cmr6